MITIQEINLEEMNAFWDKHIHYLIEDEIISDPEDIEYFQSQEYRGILEQHMQRDPDKHHAVYFMKEGKKIGAAHYCTFQSEDGKCFILDFWVFPAYRGNGMGHRCFETLEAYTKKDGALYYEINASKEASIRFWKSMGFIENGLDEYDMMTYMKR